MKIRKLIPEIYPKAASLLDHVFAPNKREVLLFDKLHEHGRAMHEWVCIVRDSVVAYIGFTNAYKGKQIVGLHLGPLAVTPQMQGQGIGSELLRFALRQDVIRESTIFVFWDVKFFQRFGFEPCAVPNCPFEKGNKKFLSLRNESSDEYIIGYEPEFFKKAPDRKSHKAPSRGKR